MPKDAQATMSYTFAYAAPQVMKSWNAGAQSCLINVAIAAWALAAVWRKISTDRKASVCCAILWV
jgi:hypothetical protein